jgi:chromate transporter
MVAMFFTAFKDNEYIIRAFKGIRPVVVALIGVPLLDMFKSMKMRWWSWLIVISSLTLVSIMSFSPIYILLCVIVVALFVSWFNNRRMGADRECEDKKE